MSVGIRTRIARFSGVFVLRVCVCVCVPTVHVLVRARVKKLPQGSETVSFGDTVSSKQ